MDELTKLIESEKRITILKETTTGTFRIQVEFDFLAMSCKFMYDPIKKTIKLLEVDETTGSSLRYDYPLFQHIFIVTHDKTDETFELGFIDRDILNNNALKEDLKAADYALLPYEERVNTILECIPELISNGYLEKEFSKFLVDRMLG